VWGSFLRKEKTMAKRIKTKYPGVFFIKTKDPQTKKPTKAFYIRYRKNGKAVEEKAGYANRGMTAARANTLRSQKIEGNLDTNAEQRAKVQAKKKAEENRWTLTRLWEDYKKTKPVGKALDTDDGRFKNYIAPEFGNKTPIELNTWMVNGFKSRLLKKLAPQTVAHVLGIIKRIIRYGELNDLCDIPAKRQLTIKMPKFDNRKTENLSDNQISALLKAADNDENWKAKGLIYLALSSGMRRGEMLNLQWSDIDFDSGFITLWDTKSGKIQKVPLNDMSKQILSELPRTENSFVFPGKKDEPLKNIYPALRRIRKNAGLPKDVRPLHSLRHAYASKLASEGVGLYTVQKLLRHSDPRMTQRYSELADQALKDGSKLAGKLFSQLKEKSSEQIIKIG
jgi:integrase